MRPACTVSNRRRAGGSYAETGAEQLDRERRADALASAQPDVEQRLEAEPLEDGGMRLLAAALARDQVSRDGRLLLDREECGDAGGEPVEHDDSAHLGGTE